MISGLINGKNCLHRSQRIHARDPIHLGDDLTVAGIKIVA